MNATQLQLKPRELIKPSPNGLVMNALALPALVGVVSALVAYWFGWTPDLPDRAAVLGFAGSIASVASTMLGFMLAALAVIVSVSNTALVQRMRTTGHYDDLVNTIMWGCVIFLLNAMAGFALMFGAAPSYGYMLTLLGLHGAACTAVIDIGRKFRLVLVNL